MIASALDLSFRAIDASASPLFTVYSVLRGEGSLEKKICVFTSPRRSRSSRVTGDFGAVISGFYEDSARLGQFPFGD
jgi:hypothetical protein